MAFDGRINDRDIRVSEGIRVRAVGAQSRERSRKRGVPAVNADKRPNDCLATRLVLNCVGLVRQIGRRGLNHAPAKLWTLDP